MSGEVIFVSIESSPSFLLSVLSALLDSICDAPVNRASMNVFESLNRIVESCTEVELWASLALPAPSVLIVPLIGEVSQYVRWLRSTMKQLLYLYEERRWVAIKQEKCLKIQFSNYVATERNWWA